MAGLMLKWAVARMKKKMQNEVYTALRQLSLEKTLEDLFNITSGELHTGFNSSGDEVMCLVSNDRILGVTERTDDAFEDVERLCAWVYYMYRTQGQIMSA